ncbi:hypothetical protein D3C71_1761190 [compost metagenome]
MSSQHVRHLPLPALRRGIRIQPLGDLSRASGPFLARAVLRAQDVKANPLAQRALQHLDGEHRLGVPVVRRQARQRLTLVRHIEPFLQGLAN